MKEEGEEEEEEENEDEEGRIKRKNQKNRHYTLEKSRGRDQQKLSNHERNKEAEKKRKK